MIFFGFAIIVFAVGVEGDAFEVVIEGGVIDAAFVLFDGVDEGGKVVDTGFGFVGIFVFAVKVLEEAEFLEKFEGKGGEFGALCAEAEEVEELEKIEDGLACGGCEGFDLFGVFAGLVEGVEAAIAECFGEVVDGGVADGTGWVVDNASERDLVRGEVEDFEVSEGVFDLFALEEGLSADEFVGDAFLTEGFFKGLGLCVGAVEDGKVAPRSFFSVFDLEELFDGVAGFFFFVG